MQPTTSTVKFQSSTGQATKKAAKRRSRPRSSAVVVTHVEPKAQANKPKVSPAVAEALYRTGRLPRIGR